MNYRKTEEDYLKVILLYVKYVCGEITRRTGFCWFASGVFLCGRFREWLDLRFVMACGLVEFVGIFSLCLVFLGETVGKVGGQSFEGDVWSLSW